MALGTVNICNQQNGSSESSKYEKVVGISTNGWTSQDCDYLCDGVDDQVEIQQALDDLETQGGTLRILPGTYLLSQSININGRITILGTWNKTLLRAQPTNGTPLSVLVNADSSGIRLEDIVLEGGTSTSYGSYAILGISTNMSAFQTNRCTMRWFENCLYTDGMYGFFENTLFNCSQIGVEIDAYAEDTTLVGCRFSSPTSGNTCDIMIHQRARIIGCRYKKIDGDETELQYSTIAASHENNIPTPRHVKTNRVTVGTSTAGWTINDCDYLCDGVDDNVEIQAAIDEAIEAGGGEVRILGGYYELGDPTSGQFQMPAILKISTPSSIKLSGEDSILNAKTLTQNASLLAVGATCEIFGLRFSCPASPITSGTSAIMCYNTSSENHIDIHNISIYGGFSYGIVNFSANHCSIHDNFLRGDKPIYTRNPHTRIINNTIQYVSYGIDAVGEDPIIHSNMFQAYNQSSNDLGTAIYIVCSSSLSSRLSIVGNTILGEFLVTKPYSGQHGILVSHNSTTSKTLLTHSVITNNTISQADTAIELGTTADTELQKCIICNNSVSGCTNGVVLTGTTTTSVIQNNI